MNDQYFTIEEIATRFKVTRQTVQNWIRTGKLESVKLGRARRILGTSVDKLVAEGRRVALRVSVTMLQIDSRVDKLVAEGRRVAQMEAEGDD